MPIDTLTAEQVSNVQAKNEEKTVERRCGPCTACCTVLGVGELEKESFKKCCHLGDGCKIYASRPQSCRNWSCNWLLGQEPGGDDRHRPDNLGLIFSVEMMDGKSGIVIAFEVWPGASEEPHGKYLLKKMAAKKPVIVTIDGGQAGELYKIVCPTSGHEPQGVQILERFKRYRATVSRKFVDELSNRPTA
jgi:hypothetical protein